MATQLKDIQFTSPVMQGNTSNNATTWTVDSTDTLDVYGGILVIDPNDSNNKILLTYANLVAHGFTPEPSSAPTITYAGTVGDGDGFVNITGTLEVMGTNLDQATEIQLLRDSGELWQTVQATYADGKLTATLDFSSRPTETGAVRVTTPDGSATYEVMYGDH